MGWGLSQLETQGIPALFIKAGRGTLRQRRVIYYISQVALMLASDLMVTALSFGTENVFRGCRKPSQSR